MAKINGGNKMIMKNQIQRSDTTSIVLSKCTCNQCGAVEIKHYADVSDEFICGSCVDEINHLAEEYFSQDWY
jgi:formylmethanofuran dehydrogenase subunit E